MPDIKNVIVIGRRQSGTLRRLRADRAQFCCLRAHSCDIYVFTWAEIKVHKTDYSEASLLQALRGQDAVVSTIGTFRIPEQKKIIDAAVKAGVKRFLPSEFGCDTSAPEAVIYVPFVSIKQEIVAYLKSKESEGLSWTTFCCGMFFDWSLSRNLLFWDLAHRKTTLFDSGDQPFEATNVRQIAKAVASTLLPHNTSEMASRYIYINSFTTTQNAVLHSLERHTGTKWDVERGSARKLGSFGLEQLKSGAKSGGVVPDYPPGAVEVVWAAMYGNGELNDFGGKAKLWNEKLGLAEEDLNESIRDTVATVRK